MVIVILIMLAAWIAFMAFGACVMAKEDDEIYNRVYRNMRGRWEEDK